MSKPQLLTPFFTALENAKKFSTAQSANMFGMFNTVSFRGVGMVFLQILRAMTIIGLTTANVACWALIIKISMGKPYFVFEGASLVFTSTIASFLTVSELPVCKTFYRNHWPAFSDRHGLSWLGISCIILGCQLLGKLNNPSNDASKIGQPWWQLVLASGILNITFGGLNLIFDLVFRDSSQGVTARDIRTHGSLAERHNDSLPSFHGSKAGSVRNEKGKSMLFSKLWPGSHSGKDHTHAPISHPMPAHQNLEGNSSHTAAPIYEEERSSFQDERRSPINPRLRRPDSALHPMHGHRASSQYSEARMSRF